MKQENENCTRELLIILAVFIQASTRSIIICSSLHLKVYLEYEKQYTVLIYGSYFFLITDVAVVFASC